MGSVITLPFSCSSIFRHTHATLLLKLGQNPKIVSERLGHANVGILDTYSHMLPDMQQTLAD
jgi:integrase